MASRLPIVATAVESVPEVLGDCGASILATAGNPEALAVALQKVLSATAEERARMGAAGHARAQGFSLGVMVKGYEALYQELLAKS